MAEVDKGYTIEVEEIRVTHMADSHGVEIMDVRVDDLRKLVAKLESQGSSPDDVINLLFLCV